MRFRLVHAGVTMGTVDLRPEAPSALLADGDGEWPDERLLMGYLEPTPAYETIRGALQALMPTPDASGGPPLDLQAIAARRERLAALGLELWTAAGAPVLVRHLDILDSSGKFRDWPPDVRAFMMSHTHILVAAQLAGRPRRRTEPPTAT